MNNLAQYLAYSTPRGSGQSVVSPLAQSLMGKQRTHWAELLGDLAMVGADKYTSDRRADKQASSIAQLLAGDPTVTEAAAGVPPVERTGATQANPEYEQIKQLLADSPELAPFFQAQALQKQYPELFAEDPTGGQAAAGPEFKVWGNNAAWVDPRTQQIDWISGGPGSGPPPARGGGSPAPAAAPPGGAMPADPTAEASVPNGKPRPLNETQSKASEFSTYMLRGGQSIDSLIEGGFRPTMMTMLMEPSQDFFGMLANQTLSPEEQQFWQGVREVAAGALRRETGAAFGAGEVKDVMARFIPLPGDSEAVIKQKRAAREGVMNTMRRSAGLDPFESADPTPAGSNTAPVGSVGGKMVEPPVPATGYPEGAIYDGPEGKFTVQDGKWWQVQ